MPLRAREPSHHSDSSENESDNDADADAPRVVQWVDEDDLEAEGVESSEEEEGEDDAGGEAVDDVVRLFNKFFDFYYVLIVPLTISEIASEQCVYFYID